jgi:hypothetical protein
MLMQSTAAEEITKKLVAINQHLLKMMLLLAAKKQGRAVDELIQEADLQKYFSDHVGIPIHVVYHYAELAGEREGISWHINRLNYTYSMNQHDPVWLARFLDRVERMIAYQLTKMDPRPV